MANRKRKFDWDLARVMLTEGGLSYPEISRLLGVSERAVSFACNDEARRRNRERKDASQRSTCIICGGYASHNTVTNRKAGRASDEDVCWTCASIFKATSINEEGLFHCSACDAWLEPEAFRVNVTAKRSNLARGGRKHTCRACESAARQAYRERHREADLAYTREYRRRRRAA